MMRESEGRLAPRNITRLVLADDNKMFRQYVKAVLDKEPGLDVVGEAEDGGAAIRLARELAPDIVIMDVVMPDPNGIEATRQIVSSLPHIKVIALSVYSDKRFVEAMVGAGASGYLLKEYAFKELPVAIRTVVGGHTSFSAELAVIVS